IPAMVASEEIRRAPSLPDDLKRGRFIGAQQTRIFHLRPHSTLAGMKIKMAWGQKRSNREAQTPNAQRSPEEGRPDATASQSAAALLTYGPRAQWLSELQVDPIESFRLTES